MIVISKTHQRIKVDTTTKRLVGHNQNHDGSYDKNYKIFYLINCLKPVHKFVLAWLSKMKAHMILCTMRFMEEQKFVPITREKTSIMAVITAFTSRVTGISFDTHDNNSGQLHT